jgi:hypothetical protein
MSDAVSAHRGASNARGVIRPDGNDVDAHDISKSHSFTSCKRRADRIVGTFGPRA